MSNQAIIVKQINVLQSLAEMVPGTLVSITDETIQVATGSRTVALRDFMTFDGNPLSPSVFLDNKSQAFAATQIHRSLSQIKGF